MTQFLPNNKVRCKCYTSSQVRMVLPDDNEGSHQQKIIFILGNGLTFLVAQNIDFAFRIKNLHKGGWDRTFLVNMNYSY
ncbi:DUF3465 domain-containing protein [Acinetobacter sp. ANC 4648]|uniref:DUF3465 domain-containing protein n=1 Tax=Acinetobacter sp. ANC 4648 TaxID=1977875 RepID=UPI003A4C5F39